MIKNIIFDVDGTILDTEKAVISSLQFVLKEEGKVYHQDELRFALGIPGDAALKKLNIPDIEKVGSKWSRMVLEFSNEVLIFNGLKQVIETLSNSPIRLGIVTSKTKQEVTDEFDPFGISHHFEHIISASDTKKHKPHPEPLMECLERMNINKENTIYIGDSIYDLQCAKSVGVKFALALWGSKSINGFETADFILNEPKDVLDLIKIEA